MISKKKKLSLALVILPLFFLPGCFNSSKETAEKSAPAGVQPVADDGSQVLVSIGGKPYVTEKTFEKEFEQLLEENPQLKGVLPLMPDAKANFLMGMVSQLVVDLWVEQNGIDKQADYQNELNRMLKSVRRMLNTKHFGQTHPVTISDADVKKFYEENKDQMPDLMVSRGGVKAVGLQFDSESAANEFLAKAKATSCSKAAESAGLSDKLRDFKLINEQSLGVDPAIRKHVLALKSCPSFDVIKVDDKTWWVVEASSKETRSYRPFEQVKAGLKQYLEKEKKMEALEKEIDKLKQKMGVTVNVEPIKSAAPAAAPMGQDAPEMPMPEAPAAPAAQAA